MNNPLTVGRLIKYLQKQLETGRLQKCSRVEMHIRDFNDNRDAYFIFPAVSLRVEEERDLVIKAAEWEEVWHSHPNNP